MEPTGHKGLIELGWFGDMPRHIQTPWQSHASHIYGPDPERALIAVVNHPGSRIPGYDLVANRDFIVRAVNAHDELVGALHELCNLMEGDPPFKLDATLVPEALDRARAALAKVEGR